MFTVPQPTRASLSLRDAHLINAALTLGYVLPLYLTKFTRLSFAKSLENDRAHSKGSSERWRDDPAVIKARLVSISVSTVASLCLMHYIVAAGQRDSLNVSERRWDATALSLGFSVRKSDALVHFVTPALFLGPLYGRYLSGDLPFMAYWTFNERTRDTFSWIGIRNYIAGPITEEVVWRSCLVCAYRLAGASNKFLVFFTPLSFGCAHLHHIWESYNMRGRTLRALKPAILVTLFQFTYTTLFGFHSAFLFLRTSSLFPSISAHTFCNIMGFPQLEVELRRFPHRRRQILIAYCAGIVLYIYGMRTWTIRPDSTFWFHGTSNQQ
ncbi:hypothetical protein F5148DRAFT_979063 [Russula earlei]|uniref:Uncharacterized protein n=1 Tax=Russula earlei TaxID=71964 RepID=A0ACC0UBB8_9AGAM|nr:hypothetical protein F5148DRAFT_979063 [Russula earlei]